MLSRITVKDPLTVSCPARIKKDTHVPCEVAANITALCHISVTEAQVDHYRVEDFRRVLTFEVTTQGRPRREAPAWQRGHDDMIRQVCRRVAFLEDLKNAEELAKAS